MRVRLALGILGLVVLGGPGCSLVGSATHLAAYRARQALDDCAERQRNERWANEAWQAVRSACPYQPFSDDHARGFKDGFARFVYRGGDGEPPPLPPSNYRTVRYQTPQGYQAIEDWFAGYRHGVSVACPGG